MQRLKEMDVSVGLKALNIHVIDRGHVPTLPTSPNVPMNLALALTLGLMCGAVAAIGVGLLRPFRENARGCRARATVAVPWRYPRF